MIALLVGYVQGRSGVLDDRGCIVQSQSNGEYRPEDIDVYNEHEEAIHELDSEESDSKQGGRNVWSVARTVGGALVFLFFIGYFARLGWIVFGWIGHNLLGLQGVWGNIAGGVASVLLLVLISMIGSRLEDARRDLRARRGTPNLDDMLSVFHLVDQAERCGACAFSIREFDPQDDGCVQCPECGAAWRSELWEEFLNTYRDGTLAKHSKKDRRRYCGFDARMQIAFVAEHETKADRAALVHKCKGGLAVWDLFVLLLILLVLVGGILVVFAMVSAIGTSVGGLTVPAVAIVVIFAIMLYAVNLAKKNFQTRKVQRYIRD